MTLCKARHIPISGKHYLCRQFFTLSSTKTMKKLYILGLFIILSTALAAQVPANYYNGTEELRGQALKEALYKIIKGHIEYPYTSSSTDVWDILKETDQDTANPDNVILFYTGWSVNAAQEYNNGKGWNREHVWAKSRGDFGTSPGPGTDINHLRPADISVNSARNNRSFDNCSKPYLDNGVPTGCYTSDEQWVWQPRKEVQGDVARMIFYMATRYEGENGEPDLHVVEYLPEKSDKSPVQAKLSILLKWNEADPVDNFERHRNDVVYSYQNNRNPFIDHPEYVNRIWGSDSTVSAVSQYNDLKIKIYPNPVMHQLHFSLAKDYTKILFSSDGRKLKETLANTMYMDNIPKGIYLLIFKDNEGNIVRRMKVVKR
jgi:endonuclease I